jgi:hypothetical protein
MWVIVWITPDTCLYFSTNIVDCKGLTALHRNLKCYTKTLDSCFIKLVVVIFDSLVETFRHQFHLRHNHFKKFKLLSLSLQTFDCINAFSGKYLGISCVRKRCSVRKLVCTVRTKTQFTF